MTILVLMSVRDTKLDAFVNLYTSPTRAAGARALQDVANDSTSTLFKHPDHFDLFEVGTFDDDSGSLTPYPTPTFVCSATSLINNGGGNTVSGDQ